MLQVLHLAIIHPVAFDLKADAVTGQLAEKAPLNRGVLQVIAEGEEQGIPVGADLEFADEITLGRALEGRRDV